MKFPIRNHRSEQGSLIIYAFLAVIILGAIAGVATYVTHNVETTHRRKSHGEAYNYSEAGVMLASSHVNYAFTNAQAAFVKNLADDLTLYAKDSQLSTYNTLVFTNTITQPFTNQAVQIELQMANVPEPPSVTIISRANVRGVSVTNTAVVELTFAFRAAIVSDHFGSSSANISKANALLGNVVIPTAEKSSPLVIDGRIMANGRANLGKVGLGSDMVSMTNYGTAKQIPDYTASDSPDQLFDFARLVKAADLTGNHYKSIDDFIKAARKEEVFEGIIVVDARKKEDEEEDKDDGKSDKDDGKSDKDDGKSDKDDGKSDKDDGKSDKEKDNKGHGNNEDGMDVDNPGKKKGTDASGDVDDEKKCGDEDDKDDAKSDKDDGKSDKDDGKSDKDDGKSDKDDGKSDKDDGKSDKDDDDDDDGPGIDKSDLPKGIYVRGTLIFNYIFDEDKLSGKSDKDDGKSDKDDGKSDKDDGKSDKEKDNKGHGNNEDGMDVDNPGKKKGTDASGDVDDEKKCGDEDDKDDAKSDKDDAKSDKDDGKSDKDDGKSDKDDGKSDKDDGKSDKDDGKDDAGKGYVAWDDNNDLLDGVALYINWVDLDTVNAANSATFSSAYPPTIQNPEKQPTKINMEAHGFKNFTAGEDLPALMFNGGSMTLNGLLDICGVIYSPNFIDIQNQDDTPQYIKGTIFAGGGVYIANNGKNSKTILSYDPNAVDDLGTKNNRGMQVAVRHRD